MGKVNNEIVEMLSAALDSEYEKVRNAAVVMLRQWKVEKLIPKLMEMILNEEDSDVIAEILITFGSFGYYNESLNEFVEHWDWWVAANAVFALGNSQEESVIPSLFKALKRCEYQVREAAEMALAKFDAQTVLKYAEEILEEEGKSHVRKYAEKLKQKLK